MTVIPAINETEFKEIKKKIKAAQDFAVGSSIDGVNWVHLDVSDGKFTRNVLWNNPEELKAISEKRQVNIEVHLMVQNPDAVLDEWLDVKVKRIIVHLEAVRDLDVMKMKCLAFGTELFIAVKPDTPVEHLFSREGDANGFVILAVNPGLAGQKFKEDQLGKIRALRQKFPDVKIEVDGGVNLENALAIKNAGADILVSASYIWQSENPKEFYKKLVAI